VEPDKPHNFANLIDNVGSNFARIFNFDAFCGPQVPDNGKSRRSVRLTLSTSPPQILASILTNESDEADESDDVEVKDDAEELDVGARGAR